MLKVTESFNSEKRTGLILEGKIVADCVSYPEKICLAYLGKNAGKVLLDFSGVRYVEPKGVGMLKRLATLNLNIVNYPIFIAELLNER